jgi:drug/metabolite transporter (DMT)-like permease
MTRGEVSTRYAAATLALVVLAWGLTWPANKVILETISPYWLAATRSWIAVLALFAIAAMRRDLIVPSRADLPVVASVALLHMTGFTLLGTIGLGIVDAGRTVVLAYTTPLWVVPGAALFLGERLTARRGLGVAIGLLGLAVLFNPAAIDWRDARALGGNAIILAAALLWAASILHVRGHRWRATPFQLVPWQMLLAALLLTAIAAPLGAPPDPARWDALTAALVLFVALPGTALAYWAVAVASRYLPAVTTSLGLLATPVVGIAVSAAALGEPLTLSLLVAVAMILGGIAIGTTGRGRG